MQRTLAGTLLALGLGSTGLQGQAPEPIRRSLDGPRFGITYAVGRRELGIMGGRKLNPWMTQFGWHEEQEVIAAARGPALIVEQIVLVGGVEQGVFVPSASALVGLRTEGGLELGVGPNLSFDGPALTVALGQSFNYGGVRIPVNVAFVHADGGVRATFLAGFAVKSRP